MQPNEVTIAVGRKKRGDKTNRNANRFVFFLHGKKSYVFVGFRKYCVAFHNVFLYYQASSPESSLCLRLSHSLYTSLLALFECVRPCR